MVPLTGAIDPTDTTDVVRSRTTCRAKPQVMRASITWAERSAGERPAAL
ncbi:hypothetical protein GGR60_001673 [Xanthomonas arboricola]|nr:hypothetical protein [Xanthomonas euroxanthea]NJC37138.1 hypothetical protein [Xanthomonas euroxanthea]